LSEDIELLTVLGEPFTESLVVGNARDLRRPTLAQSTLQDTHFHFAGAPFSWPPEVYEAVDCTQSRTRALIGIVLRSIG